MKRKESFSLKKEKNISFINDSSYRCILEYNKQLYTKVCEKIKSDLMHYISAFTL